MFNQENLKELSKINSLGNTCVSLYLNLDQKNVSTEKIKIKLKNFLTKISDIISKENAAKISGEVDQAIEKRAKSIVIFTDNHDYFQVYNFNKSLISAVFVEKNLHITPLQQMLDEYERYAVLTINNEDAKIYLVYLGEIEEIKKQTDYFPGKHAQGGWSQKRFQGHIEDHLEHHIKNSSKVVYEIWKQKKFDRLILGGTEEIIAKLVKELPKELGNKIAGKFNLQMFLPAQDVLDQAEVVEKKAERDHELRVIQELENNLGVDNRAVSGIRDVLNNLNNKKVNQLIIQNNLELPGYYCQICGMLSLENKCGCGQDATPIDLVDEMVQAALNQGAKVEFIDDTEKMSKLGDVGAILRY